MLRATQCSAPPQASYDADPRNATELIKSLRNLTTQGMSGNTYIQQMWIYHHQRRGEDQGGCRPGQAGQGGEGARRGRGLEAGRGRALDLGLEVLWACSGRVCLFRRGVGPDKRRRAGSSQSQFDTLREAIRELSFGLIWPARAFLQPLVGALHAGEPSRALVPVLPSSFCRWTPPLEHRSPCVQSLREGSWDYHTMRPFQMILGPPARWRELTP